MSLLIGYFSLALIISFICSMLESVILSVTHSYIGTMSKDNPRGGELILKLKDDINRPLAAILTLNTIANTVGAAGVGAQALVVYGSGAVAIASAVLTFVFRVKIAANGLLISSFNFKINSPPRGLSFDIVPIYE
jgi:Mg2+/Co2+ transporter CorB